MREPFRKSGTADLHLSEGINCTLLCKVCQLPDYKAHFLRVSGKFVYSNVNIITILKIADVISFLKKCKSVELLG